VQHRVTMGGISLVAKIQLWTLLSVGSSMNVQDERVLASCGKANRLGQKGFDVPLEVIAQVRERFHRGQLFATQPLAVEVGQCASRTARGRTQEQFSKIRGSGDGVGDGA